MKKMVHQNLSKIIIVSMLVTLALNCVFQIHMTELNADSSTEMIFWQINHILSENQKDIKKITADFDQKCIMKAKTLAYILKNNPDAIDNPEEIKKLIKYLQIQEFHIFDEKGVLYAGSESKYWGYTFNSGEQMSFFLPMLKDKSLELCQPITPNTAEGKLMQYSAVWQDDGSNIIQIGMNPDTVLDATKKNELSYIFSLLTDEKDSDLYAVDPDTYEILGSTDKHLTGKNLTDIGVDQNKLDTDMKSFHARINGVSSYCTFTRQNDVLVGRIRTSESLYKTIWENTLLIALYMLILSLVMISGISRYLNKNIIQGINAVNGKLQMIASGNLKETVDVYTTEEFKELSMYINLMVKSLLDTTDKLSSVLDTVQIPIGIYEYTPGTGRVQILGKIAEFLALPNDEMEKLLIDYKLFEEKLADIRSCPISESETVFQLPGNTGRYVKLDSYIKKDSIFGIMMDVTNDVNEKRHIVQQLDEDVLTGLYNRRGFYAKLDSLFKQPQILKQAVFIAIDTDFLKMVNDTYGHESGDCYLRGMADVLRSVTAPCHIASRLSGDEFALFIYGCADREELNFYIQEFAAKQNGSIAVYPHEDLPIPLHFSMGCAFYPDDGKDYTKLALDADTRMYEQKRINHKQRGS